MFSCGFYIRTYGGIFAIERDGGPRLFRSRYFSRATGIFEQAIHNRTVNRKKLTFLVALYSSIHPLLLVSIGISSIRPSIFPVR